MGGDGSRSGCYKRCMSPEIRVLPCGDDQMPALLALRLAMFSELDGLTRADDARLAEAHRAWFARHREACEHWLAWSGEAAVGCCSLGLFPRPPYPGHLQGLEAYLLNVYVQPDQRRHGVARALVDAALARSQALGAAKVWLHASEAGRPLYQGLGFHGADTYLEWTPPAA